MARVRAFREGAERLAAGRYDAALLLTNSFSSAWQVARAGIGERWGYAADLRQTFLTRAVARRQPTENDPRARHHSQYYLRLVAALGFRGGSPEAARLVCPPALGERGLRILCEHGACPDRPIVGLAPGAAYGHAKRWPPELAAALVAQIVARTSAAVVVVGAAGDRDTARQLQSSIVASGVAPAGRVVDLVGHTSLGELLGVVAACRAFVSNDSGVMHLAAAFGVPVVAVFGPTDERATAPLGPHRVVTATSWCRPCQLRECPIDHHCMRGIAPATVFAALEDVLT
jgi:heptosyltransferase II